MSKRFGFPQQNGERKKARLDISVTDHNFPLSQNVSSNKESIHADNWGDDNDDEILLLASQVCEEAYSTNDISSLPDYSVCMQPSSTSTQMFDQPGSSKSEFSFKKPSVNQSSIVTSNLKFKCDRISSPLPGISKVVPKVNDLVNFSDDLVFNDKIHKGQDSDYVYRQLLLFKEENAKLKSENSKLLEKCVTKEGEASILRTQLKACQVAVDNARLDRIKAQEKVQQEWTEKLTTANDQLRDIRTQLDFKNLEIISVKERCKMLKSSKVKLTQVTVPTSDISTSHRHNGTVHAHNGSALQSKRLKVTNSSVQTDNKAHIMNLNKSYRSETSKLSRFLPLILETTTNPHSILDCNEKLQNHSDFAPNKCQIFNTFHRTPAPSWSEARNKRVTSLSCIYEDLTSIAMGGKVENYQDRFFKIINTIRVILIDVQKELELVSHRLTTAFQREMDERYMEASAKHCAVDEKQLLSGRPLYNEEQAILARRVIAILAFALETSANVEIFINCEQSQEPAVLDILCRICNLLDINSSAVLYSGLLLSVTILVKTLYPTIKTSHQTKLAEIVKYIITCRSIPCVYTRVVGIVRKMTLDEGYLSVLCPSNGSGNLRIDYDQGVLLYKKDSCLLQVLLKQIEVCLKCMEKENRSEEAVKTAQDLIGLHSNINCVNTVSYQEKRCECQLVLVQIIVYALRVCAVMLTKCQVTATCKSQLLSACRAGVQVVYMCVQRDPELCPQLQDYEGHLIQFCEIIRDLQHPDVYVTMLSEVSGTFQSSPEETPCYQRQAWLQSFDLLSVTD